MSASAYERLRRQVLEDLERQRIDPLEDHERARSLISDAVAAYQRTADAGGDTRLVDARGMARRLFRSIAEYGPLTEVLASPDVEEVFIEGARVTWMDRSGRLHGLAHPTTAVENRAVIERLLAPTGRSLDTRSPMVQARVLGGAARLSAAIAPVADGLSATIRRHAQRHVSLPDMVSRGSLSAPAADLLRLIMAGWSSVIVSGQPGAGKTSMLAALMAAVPTSRCVRVCEEVRELHVPLTHGSYYETRVAAWGDDAPIDLRALVRFCLGMRCELLVVGEVRGAEAFELTRAVNAGTGFACTVHANSGADALEALSNAAIMAGEQVTEPLVRRVFSSAIDLIVHVDRSGRADHGAAPGVARREVREVLAVMPSMGDGFATEPIFTRPDGPGTPMRWTGVIPPRLAALTRTIDPQIDLTSLLEGSRPTGTAPGSAATSATAGRPWPARGAEPAGAPTSPQAVPR